MHPQQEQQPTPAQQPVYYVPVQQPPAPQVISTSQGQWLLLVLIFIMLLVNLGFTLYLFGVVHAAANPF